MKKKIRDLTNEDVDKICKNYVSCEKCPLYRKTKPLFVRLCEPIKIFNNFKKDLNKEIEVEE